MTRKKRYILEGVVFDQSTGLPLEGASVYLSNYCNNTMNTIKSRMLKVDFLLMLTKIVVIR